MTLLVSDEVELVEPNIDFHLAQGVDFLIVTVNRGSDEVVQKVQGYVDRGVASLIHEPSHTYAQAEWVTRMARLACTEHGADWVINCDPDEFYWPQGGSLKELLSLVPEEYGRLPMPVCHFLPPCPERGESGFFADRMTVRETWSMKPGGMAPFYKTAHRAAESVSVGRGNHRVFGVDFAEVPGWRPIFGLHFPVRSYEQFERKVIKDGRAVANNPDPKISHGGWRDLYILYESGDLKEEYAARCLDVESEARGLQEGALVIDERLRRWFAERRAMPLTEGGDGQAHAAAVETGVHRAEEAERLERLRGEMRRAIFVGAREIPVLERDALRGEVEALKVKVDALRDKATRRELKIQEYKRKLEKLKTYKRKYKDQKDVRKHEKSKAWRPAAKSNGRSSAASGEDLAPRNGHRLWQVLRGRTRSPR
jgi:hypothetical protein